MTEQCENCGKPVLATDAICWHCGWQRPLQNINTTQQDDETPTEEIPDPFPLPLIAVYGGITAVALLLLLIVMLALSRQPSMVVNPDIEDGEWAAVTDLDQHFVMELPVGWQVVDSVEMDAVSEELLATAVTPLGPLVDDGEVLFFAQNDPAILVVIKSEQLAQLSLDQIISSLRGESFAGVTVADSRRISNIAEQEQGAFRIQHAGQDWQCRQRLGINRFEAYLLALCLPNVGSGHIQQHLSNILTSFQLLQRE